MIVNYPYARLVPWIPRGMRKARAFVIPETMPVEIRELSSDEAPAVVVGKADDRYGQSDETSTFRRAADGWYVATAAAPTAEQVWADPTILGLCAPVGKSDSHRGIFWRGTEIATGPTTLVPEMAHLGIGKVLEVEGFDPMQGRPAEVAKAAADLILVDGVIHVRTVEPTLRLDTTHYLYDSYTSAGLQTKNLLQDQGYYFRADRVEDIRAARLRVAANAGKHHHVSDVREEFEVLRPDLLEFDPVPHVVASVAADVLRDMCDHLRLRPVGFLVTYADLRDTLYPETTKNWDADSILASEVRVDDPDAVLEKVVAGLRWLASDQNDVDHLYGTKHRIERVLDKMQHTRLLRTVVEAIGDEIETFGVTVPTPFDELLVEVDFGPSVLDREDASVLVGMGR